MAVLPSAWLGEFDEVDETLLWRAVEADPGEGSEFLETLRAWHDGPRLLRRWDEWIDAACRCRLLPAVAVGRDGVPQFHARDACPFVRLLRAIAEVSPQAEIQPALRMSLEGVSYLAEVREVAIEAAARTGS
jgi:hypothetical protein